MYKEKLDKAAKDHVDKVAPLMAYTAGLVFRAFIAGARWLLSQPLFDRLTDEESEKIRRIYNGDFFGDCDFIEMASTRSIFQDLFGSECFYDENSSNVDKIGKDCEADERREK